MTSAEPKAQNKTDANDRARKTKESYSLFTQSHPERRYFVGCREYIIKLIKTI